MIVPMKKVTVLCLERHREEALEYLRQLGALHVEPVRTAEHESVEAARRHYEHIRTALDLLPERPSALPSGRTPDQTVEALWALLHERAALRDEREPLAHEIARWAPYGDLDPARLRALAGRGVRVRLCQARPGEPVTLPPGAVRVECGADKSAVWFAVLTRDETPIAGGTEHPWPERRPSVARARLAAVDARLAEIETEAAEMGGDRPFIVRLRADAEDAVRFAEARAGMGGAEGLPVVYIRGYAPAEHAGCFLEAARGAGWGIRVEDPGEDDAVPTLVRPPRWARPIEAVFKLVGILPGYREIDISAVFLLFFSLFFAMLVGDAGYGLLFLGLTLWAKKKARGKPSAAIALMLIMSVCTIIWGVLTGTWFGLARLPAILGPKVPWLTDQDNLMGLCFLIGAVQLSLAHVWNIARDWKSPQALAQLGWLGVTWSMYFAARTMVLNQPFPGVMMGILAASIGLVVLFMTPVRKLKTEWFNHVMLPLNLVSSFVDIVSYIRLFAVGTATVAVAQAFNGIALGGGVSGIGGGIMAAVILFIGHALNVVLAGMGVIVHGVRLNTLEFSGHLGMQWTGVPYRPLARTVTEGAEDPR